MAGGRCYLIVVGAVVLAAADIQEVVNDSNAWTVHADGCVVEWGVNPGDLIITHQAVAMAHYQLLAH